MKNASQYACASCKTFQISRVVTVKTVEYVETGRANDSFHDFDNVTDQIVLRHEVVKRSLLLIVAVIIS